MAGPSAPASSWLYEIFAHQVVLRLSGEMVQWKYDTQPDTAWQDLFDLSLVEGPQGPQGPQGLPGLDGADGLDGVDGAPGAPGVVQAIVAGTNVTVDATDPANPIVSASGGGGGSGGMALIPSAAYLTPNSYTDVAYAFRGNEVFCREDIDVLGLIVHFSATAADTEQYKAVAFRITRSSDLVHEVYESQVLSPPTGTVNGECCLFKFTTPVPCKRQVGTTQAWVFGIVRLDGMPTDPCRIGYNSSFANTLWSFFALNGEAFRADNTVPVVGGNYVTNAGAGHFPFTLLADFPSL